MRQPHDAFVHLLPSACRAHYAEAGPADTWRFALDALAEPDPDQKHKRMVLPLYSTPAGVSRR